jgi:hypothetical protein
MLLLPEEGENPKPIGASYAVIEEPRKTPINEK